ncbi:MAG: ferric reductase-like transmembrane domain-containing protein [Rhizobiaceae bacterium]
MSQFRATLIWGAFFTAIAIPIAIASASPLLAWREPVYIAAGFAGIIGLCLLLIQPLMIGGYLPGLTPIQARRLHRWTGGILVFAVVAHIAGLWITSPPDVIDALLFVSPTPFSVWGVLAMWAVFATATLAIFRRRLRPRNWRVFHTLLAVVIVTGTVIHAMLIEGTMGTVSKAALCALVLVVTAKAMIDLRVWFKRTASR